MLYCKKQGEEATVMPNDSFSFISERLYALMDEKYKKFQCSLIPTVDPGRVLGVRVPELRKIAREFWSAGQTSEFMRTLPHKTYEEDNIHGFLIERITDFDKAICELDIFLPYVDNWATCDIVRPKILKKTIARCIAKLRNGSQADAHIPCGMPSALLCLSDVTIWTGRKTLSWFHR